MASSLFTANPSLASALTDLEVRKGFRALSITPLEGTGNRSFRVDHNEGTIALRLNAATEHLGVDRDKEKTILEALQGTGIAPPVYQWHEHYLATEFVTADDTASLSSIARVMKALHELSPPPGLVVGEAWTPLKTLQDYLALIHIPLPEVERQTESLTNVDWSKMAYGICHIDPNPHNIISPSDLADAMLIDWEYARYGPLAYDLAVLIETHHLDATAMAELLDQYQNAPDSIEIELNRLAYRLIEALWLHITQPETWKAERIEALAIRLDAEPLSLLLR